jgi:ankyrin repeat protein
MSKKQSAKSMSSLSLAEAILSGSLQNVKRLVLARAGVNKRGRDGFTPLMLALNSGSLEIVRYLLSEGADVNARNEIGQTPVMLAAQAGSNDLVQTLILAGADLKATDLEDRNAISWATTRGDFPEIISLLGVSGSAYDLKDIRGLTPLMRAALMGYSGAAAVLLTLGADESIRFEGKTAYELAAAKGNKEVCSTIRDVLRNRPKGHRV